VHGFRKVAVTFTIALQYDVYLLTSNSCWRILASSRMQGISGYAKLEIKPAIASEGGPAPSAGGLQQPPVVPHFLESLRAVGATPTRIDAYTTKQGISADDIGPEAALMGAGCVSAVLFTSTAEAQGLVNALGGVDVLQRLVADKGAHFVCYRVEFVYVLDSILEAALGWRFIGSFRYLSRGMYETESRDMWLQEYASSIAGLQLVK
jgi:hypothetical protein